MNKEVSIVIVCQIYVNKAERNLKYLIILRERGRAQLCEWGKGRERGERARIPSRLCDVSAEPYEGFDLTNHDIMT